LFVQGTTVNLAQLTDDNKTVQYITQPFGYGNYALVNQMQVAQNGLAGIATVDGRQLIVNKPITAVIAIIRMVSFFESEKKNLSSFISRTQYQI
jgi:hypothetical protein